MTDSKAMILFKGKKHYSLKIYKQILNISILIQNILLRLKNSN